MTDRELLELAAKAAGIELGKDSPWRTYSDASGFDWMNMDGSKIEKKWTPLHNDGDALRLVADLRINIEWEREWVVWADEEFFEDIKHHPDTAAAVRRVIVRAAAKIGTGMP